MTIVLLLLIALGWTAWLTPRFVQHRREAHPSGSIDAFHQQLSTLSALDRTARRAASAPLTSVDSPRSVVSRRHDRTRSASALLLAHRVAPPATLTRRQARQRRRDLLCALLTAAGLTLLPALFLGPVALSAHLLVDAALFAYVALLVRAQKLATERRLKVRYLPRHPSQPAALLLRRSASS